MIVIICGEQDNLSEASRTIRRELPTTPRRFLVTEENYHEVLRSYTKAVVEAARYITIMKEDGEVKDRKAADDDIMVELQFPPTIVTLAPFVSLAVAFRQNIRAVILDPGEKHHKQVKEGWRWNCQLDYCC